MQTSRKLLAAALLVVAGTAFAQPGPGPKPNAGPPVGAPQGAAAGHPGERPTPGHGRPDLPGMQDAAARPAVPHDGMRGPGPEGRGMPPPMDSEHFPKAKAFAQKNIAERLRVLQDEQRCVEAAGDGAALRTCHEAARGARREMMERTRPQFEQLRQGAQR